MLIVVTDNKAAEALHATVLAACELTGALRAGGLAIFKLPEQIECITEMPRTPTGKIQKFRLHELLAERAA